VSSDGRVNFTAEWNLDTTNPNNTSLFPSIESSDYDVGYISLSNFIQVSGISTNRAFSITAHRGTWSLPIDYSPLGSKHNESGPINSDSDVKLYLSSITAGSGAASMIGQGSYGSDYTVISNSSSPSTILGSTGSVTNAAANINLRVMLDWANDIEGLYSITVTLTFVDNGG
tara:strand:+ start:161 stop:676 length:516 start_codon:yes stop_codon:yes gene_type:complete